jgi:hypothetical protein
MAVAIALFVVFSGADFAIMAEGAAGPHATEHFVANPRPGFTSWQANMAANLRENASFFVDGRVLPPWMSAMALLGTGWLIAGRWFAPLAFYWVWIVGFTLALSPWPFGDFAAAHSADTWRFSVSVSLPVLMLGGRGAEWTARRLGPVSATALAALLIGLGALAVTRYAPFCAAPHPGLAAWTDLETAARQVPGRACVVTADRSAAVALREGLGVEAVLEEGLTRRDLETWPHPLYAVTTGDASLSTGWEGVAVDVVWTSGPQATGGATLYRREAPPSSP